jgi:hypothetical protein
MWEIPPNPRRKTKDAETKRRIKTSHLEIGF